jgi:hypothetical protein
VSRELIDLAKKLDTSLAARLRTHFAADKLGDGSAVLADRGDFLYVLQSASEPTLYIDDAPAPAMKRLDGDLWFHTAKLLQGWSHAHYYRVGGKQLGDRRFDTAAYLEDSYEQPGVPQGKLSEMMVHSSAVYQGWKVSWWLYASPGVDPATPAPVMIWADGHRFLQRDIRARLFPLTENLLHQKKIPPMVHVLVSPTLIDDPVDGPYTPNNHQNMRSLLYDTVNGDYNSMIFGEIFPKAETMYKLRADGYSTGACGQSSGGICAFNQAWQWPERVGRVISRIGTFTSIQWRYGQENKDNRYGFQDPPDALMGGEMFPFLVRRREKKNFRVWLSDGAYDHELPFGSWPLQNIQLANSLKMKEYDFRFRFGNNQHNTELGEAELPKAMAWLWRGYDPAKTHEEFVIDPVEKARPLYRVGIVNRSAR